MSGLPSRFVRWLHSRSRKGGPATAAVRYGSPYGKTPPGAYGKGPYGQATSGPPIGGGAPERQPVVGGDIDAWGGILNNYLSVNTGPNGALISSTLAGLKPASTAGRLAWVTDDVRGMWRDDGTRWRKSFPSVDALDFGLAANGVTNDTSALLAAIQAAEASTNYRHVILPSGVIMVDPDQIAVASNNPTALKISGTWSRDGAANRGTVIRARATGTTLFQLNAIRAFTMEDVWLDSNRLTTNTLRTTGASSSLASFHRITFLNPADNGINLAIQPAGADQNSEYSFYDPVFLSAATSTGVRNVRVESSNSLNHRFYGATFGGTVADHIQLTNGSIHLHNPNFTGTSANDMNLTGGFFTIQGGRSETTLSGSVINLTLIGGPIDISGFVSSATTFITNSVTTATTGIITVAGSSGGNITQSSTIVPIILVGYNFAAGTGINGSQPNNVIVVGSKTGIAATNALAGFGTGNPIHRIFVVPEASDGGIALQRPAGGQHSRILFYNEGGVLSAWIRESGTTASLEFAAGNAKVFEINSTGRLKVASSTNRLHIPVVATASLPAAGALEDGSILIEDAAVGDRNLVIYAGGQRFRIDGGPAV